MCSAARAGLWYVLLYTSSYKSVPKEYIHAHDACTPCREAILWARGTRKEALLLVRRHKATQLQSP